MNTNNPYDPNQNIPNQTTSYQMPNTPPYQQPGQFNNQQPIMQQQPLPHQKISAWWKRQRNAAKLGIGCLVLFMIFSCIIGSTLASALQTPAPTAASPSTQTAAKPTSPAKPTPTKTAQQQIEASVTQLAQGATLFGSNIKVTYDKKTTNITIAETIGEALDNSSAKVEIKNECFNIQKAVWGAHTKTGDVYIQILGPLTDKFGNNTTGMVGSCELTQSTANQFQWNNLDYENAWDNNDYDSQWYLPALDS